MWTVGGMFVALCVVAFKKQWTNFKTIHITCGITVIILSIIAPHLFFFQVLKLNMHSHTGAVVMFTAVIQLMLGSALALLDYSKAKGSVKDGLKKAHKVLRNKAHK